MCKGTAGAPGESGQPGYLYEFGNSIFNMGSTRIPESYCTAIHLIFPASKDKYLEDIFSPKNLAARTLIQNLDYQVHYGDEKVRVLSKTVHGADVLFSIALTNHRVKLTRIAVGMKIDVENPTEIGQAVTECYRKNRPKVQISRERHKVTSGRDMQQITYGSPGSLDNLTVFDKCLEWTDKGIGEGGYPVSLSPLMGANRTVTAFWQARGKLANNVMDTVRGLNLATVLDLYPGGTQHRFAAALGIFCALTNSLVKRNVFDIRVYELLKVKFDPEDIEKPEEDPELWFERMLGRLLTKCGNDKHRAIQVSSKVLDRWLSSMIQLDK